MALYTKNGDVLLKNINIKLDIVDLGAQIIINQKYYNNDNECKQIYCTQPETISDGVVNNYIVKTNCKQYYKIKHQKITNIDDDIFVEPKENIELVIEYFVGLDLLDMLDRLNKLNKLETFDISDTLEQIKIVIPNNILLPNNCDKYDNNYHCDIHGNIFVTDGIKGLESKTSKINMFHFNKNSIKFEILDINHSNSSNQDIILLVTKRNEIYKLNKMDKKDKINKLNKLDRFDKSDQIENANNANSANNTNNTNNINKISNTDEIILSKKILKQIQKNII